MTDEKDFIHSKQEDQQRELNIKRVGDKWTIENREMGLYNPNGVLAILRAKQEMMGKLREQLGFLKETETNFNETIALGETEFRKWLLNHLKKINILSERNDVRLQQLNAEIATLQEEINKIEPHAREARALLAIKLKEKERGGKEFDPKKEPI